MLVKSAPPTPPIPMGTYPAIFSWIIGIGTQDSPYGQKCQIIVGYELPTLLHTFDEEKGPEPRMYSKFYTLSIGTKATLGKHLTGLMGRGFTPEESAGFELHTLMGQNCTLSIGSKLKADNTPGDEIIGMGPPTATYTSAIDQIYFDLNAQPLDKVAWERIPDWIKGKIEKANEWSSIAGELGTVVVAPAPVVQQQVPAGNTPAPVAAPAPYQPAPAQPAVAGPAPVPAGYPPAAPAAAPVIGDDDIPF